MPSSEALRCSAIQAARATYGDAFARLRFLDREGASTAASERRSILDRIRDRVSLSSRETKLHLGALSPGCATCVAGSWSCLFVTGRCNLRCFYCPTPQESVGVPATNTVAFPRPRDYVDYLASFGFRGASLSGGEPLLTLDRTLAYIKAVKQRFGGGLHVWIYTNGTLLDAATVARLQTAGLDEIRFDIGATGYRLDKVAMAVPAIPHVTVEVPAIPEHFEEMKQRLGEMRALGVSSVNLHQLRLTPHNLPELTKRDYTFVVGEEVTVLESEMVALRLLEHAVENEDGPAINYCSFPYKQRFQRAAARRRSAEKVRYGYETITENGLLRRLALVAAPQVIADRVERLRRSALPGETWTQSGDRLYFAPEAWELVEPSTERVVISHFGTRIVHAPSYRARSFEVALNRKRRVFVEKDACGTPIELAGSELAGLRGLLRGTASAVVAASPGIAAIVAREQIEPGLQDYHWVERQPHNRDEPATRAAGAARVPQ